MECIHQQLTELVYVLNMPKLVDARVAAKDLWPGMIVAVPDPEGIKAPTCIQVLTVTIVEVRRCCGDHLKYPHVGSTTEIRVDGTTLENERITRSLPCPDYQLPRLFGPILLSK